MKIIFPFFFIFIISCNANVNKIELTGIKKDSTYIIQTKAINPTVMTLHIKGEVNDTFMINNNKFGGGKINETFKADWYSKKLIIDYKSYKATQGKLFIEYEL